MCDYRFKPISNELRCRLSLMRDWSNVNPGIIPLKKPQKPWTKQIRVAKNTVIQNQVADSVVNLVVRLVGQAGKCDSGVSSFISMSLPSHDHMLITRRMSRLEEGEKGARGKVPLRVLTDFTKQKMNVQRQEATCCNLMSVALWKWGSKLLWI